jgi:NaMN:DMB phosphoribosyltransferase
MQVVAAALMLRASATMPVLLGGGTQMLAVYALGAAWAEREGLPWCREAIAIGTTAWVMADATSDAQGLAEIIGDRYGSVPLLSTRLSFATSRHPALQRYEQGFVKEGVAAGASAIATSLSLGLSPMDLIPPIDALTDRYLAWRDSWA